MLKNYITVAWRNMRRNKTFSLINILGLAAGLAAFWLIALYVADESTYDTYHVNASRIYRVAQHMKWDGGGLNIAPTPPPMAAALKADYPEIEQTVRIDAEGGGQVSYSDKKLQVNDMIVTDSSFFQVFSYTFIQGNALSALARPNSIVLTKTLAQKLFGVAGNAINKTLTINNVPGMVTGVIQDVPANSHFSFSGVRSFSEALSNNWQQSYLYTYILLKKSAKLPSLEARLPAFYNNHIKASMGTMEYRMELQPLQSIHLYSHLDYELHPTGNITYIYVFSIVAILILLMAFINYANLSTARASVRVKEVGVRKVNGSKASQLVGLFLTESVLLTLIAGLIAVAIAYTSFPLFQQLTGKSLVIWHFGVLQTILAIIVFALLAGLVTGIYPALLLSRFKPIPALKGKTSNQNNSALLRKSLVIFQFIITIGMIAGSITIYMQLQYLSAADLGFNKNQVITFHLNNNELRSKIPAIKEELLRSPYVESVATAGNPIGNNDIGGSDYTPETNRGAMDTKARMAKELVVDEDFINTLQVKMLQGRNFAAASSADKDEYVLVNQTLVSDAGWKQPVGKRIIVGEDSANKPVYRRVAGVVHDFHIYSLQHKVEPLILFLPNRQSDKDNMYVRLNAAHTKEALQHIEQVYARFDKDNKPAYTFLDQNFANQYKAEQRQGMLLNVFTVLSVLISCLGLFGLITFTAQQRIREIGIRKVLGASVASIVALLSKDFLKLVVAAFVIAIPIAWLAMSKWLQGFAYRIHLGSGVFIAAGIFALVLTLITVSYQSIKAAIANPVKSLRTE